MKDLKKHIILIIITLIVSFQASAQDFISVGEVKIYFKTTPDMFPAAWIGGNINAKAIDSKNINKTDFINKLKTEISKYPTKVITGNIHVIYIVDDLSFYGYTVGGSYFNNSGKGIIYINSSVVLSGAGKLDRIFHHEFCSILYSNVERVF